MATTLSPDDLIFGTPTSIQYGGVEAGATISPPEWSVEPELYKPMFENAVGPVKGAVFITGAAVQCKLVVNEFSAEKIAWAMPGATEVGGVITWSPGRVADTAFKDLVLVGKNLAGNDLTLTVKNALPEGKVTIPFAKSAISGMELTFVGYVDSATPQVLPFEIELGAAS